MERHLAIVENRKVVNVCVVDTDDTKTIADLGGRLLPEGSKVGIGWDCDASGNFTAPPVPEPIAPQASEVEILKQALLDNGVLTAADINAAKLAVKK